MKAKHYSDRNTIGLLLHYLWCEASNRVKGYIVLAFVCLLLSKIANILIPILFKKSIDSLALTTVPLFILIALGVTRVCTQLFNELKEICFVSPEQDTIKRVALEVFKHMHSLSLRFHLDRKTGGLGRSIERGTKAIENVLRFSMFNIIPTCIEIALVCSTLLYLYDYYYALIVLSTLCTYVYYTLSITQWRTKSICLMKETDNKVGFYMLDSLLNYETIKYFNNEEHEIAKHDKLLRNYTNIAVRNRLTLSLLNIGQVFIIALGLTLIMTVAAYNVVANRISIGDFVLLNVYLIQLQQPLSNLGFSYREIKLSLVDVYNMFNTLAFSPEVTDTEHAPSLQVNNGEIVFNKVSFSYDKKKRVLHDLSFRVPANKTVAIVGTSGAGKSTITKLLFRFYDIDTGAILIDGQDIREVTQKSLRAALAVVPQDTVLFNDTIYQNILYGRINASFSEVREVVRLAQLHNFIDSLPNRYDTMVGERGLKLSGGEKQRIAIARALLKHPSIFIFDEATSALDTKTEQAIQQNLQDISVGYTTLIIAHRLSTIVTADQIMVLHKGRIAESGTHIELLQARGIYHHMWQVQQREQKT